MEWPGADCDPLYQDSLADETLVGSKQGTQPTRKETAMSTSLTTLALTLIPPGNITAYLAARNIPAPEEADKAFELALKSAGVKTQADFAALMINLTKGLISAPSLTETLKVAFPTDKVGTRHGPYYLSHARTGKLKVDYVPGKRNTGAQAAPQPDMAALRAELEDLKARIELALSLETIEEVKAALAE